MEENVINLNVQEFSYYIHECKSEEYAADSHCSGECVEFHLTRVGCWIAILFLRQTSQFSHVFGYSQHFLSIKMVFFPHFFSIIYHLLLLDFFSLTFFIPSPVLLHSAQSSLTAYIRTIGILPTTIRYTPRCFAFIVDNSDFMHIV